MQKHPRRLGTVYFRAIRGLDRDRRRGGCRPVAASVLERMERKTLREVLQSHGGNVTAAARTLGISRSRLRYRLKKYGLTGG